MNTNTQKESRFADGDQRLKAMREAEYPGGVVVDPVPITVGEEVTVLYYGLLTRAGADQLWLHTGYGRADKWQDTYDYPMEQTGRGWVKTFIPQGEGPLHICFKDSANNWDNNNGLNWTYQLHQGGRTIARH